MKYDLVAWGRACLDDMALIDGRGTEKGKVPILQSKRSGGGQAGTSAVMVAMMGGKSAFFGFLGKDADGDQVKREMDHFGVDTQHVMRPDSYKTPRALILVSSVTGERHIYYEPTPENHIGSIPADLLKEAKTIILDPQIREEDLKQVLEHKRDETLIIYDAERNRPCLAQMKEAADFFIASETILNLDPKVKPFEMYQVLKREIQGEFLITFGEEGSIWVKKDGSLFHVGALQGLKVLDTTGAGDVYHAAFAFYFPRLKDVAQTMIQASCCAGISTQFLGTREEIDFVKQIDSGKYELPVGKTIQEDFLIDLVDRRL